MPTHNALSYERFTAAADELVAAGTKPSLLTQRMLRDKVGGSFSTIVGYLKTYKDAHPELVPHPNLPPELLSSIQTVLTRERNAVRGECANQLTFLQQQNDELTADLAAAEVALERHSVESQQLATARDSALGQVSQLLEQVHDLKAELASAQHRSQAALRQANAAQSQTDVAQGSLVELRQQTEAQLTAMRAELSGRAVEVAELHQSTRVTEVQLAEARALLEAERAARAALDERLAQAEDSLRSHQTQAITSAVATAEVSSLTQQLVGLQRENATLQALVQSVVVPHQAQRVAAGG